MNFAPFIVELSDSDESDSTPVSRAGVSRSSEVRIENPARFASFCNDSDVVCLGSDSDDDLKYAKAQVEISHELPPLVERKILDNINLEVGNAGIWSPPGRITKATCEVVDLISPGPGCMLLTSTVESPSFNSSHAGRKSGSVRNLSLEDRDSPALGTFGTSLSQQAQDGQSLVRSERWEFVRNGYGEGMGSPSNKLHFKDLAYDHSDPDWVSDYKPAFPNVCRNSGGSGVSQVDLRKAETRLEQILSAFVDLDTSPESGEGIMRAEMKGKSSTSLDENVFRPSVENLDSSPDFPPSEGLATQTTKGRQVRTADSPPVLAEALDDTIRAERVELSRKRNATGRKCSKRNATGRKCSAEELEAREAQKYTERCAKRARKEEEKRIKDQKREEEKRAREQTKEELRRQKEAAKAESVERRKVEKETDRWRKGKYALKNTIAYIDAKLTEMKDLGHVILRELGDKALNFRIVPNPVERTILWRTKTPSLDSQMDSEEMESQTDFGCASQPSCSQFASQSSSSQLASQPSSSQLALEDREIKYMVVVFEARDFTTMVGENALHSHLEKVKKFHPGYSVCYLIVGLRLFLYKIDQHNFKNKEAEPKKRPNVEQALADFVTHYDDVYSHDFLDVPEIAGHIAGLMRSLATCPFKQKLTSLSVQANGDHVTKSDPNKEIVKKSTWLKVLVAIPNITGAIAIAVAKVYPTMRALLDVYLDPLVTTHEKEILLENIVKDVTLGAARTEGRRVGPVASKRIHRVLMAQDGDLSTEDAEAGADHFTGDE